MKHMLLGVLGVVAVLGAFSQRVESAPSAYVEVSPDPTHVGDAVVFSGCGYGSRQKDIYVEIYSATGEYGAFAVHTTGSTGCFSSAGVVIAFADAGLYEVYVFPDRSRGDGRGTYNFNKALVEEDFEVFP